MKPALPTISTGATARTSSRKDVALRNAEEAISEYAHLVGVAFDETAPYLRRALAATYAAVIHLQQHPEELAAFLTPKGPGPASANPLKAIVRKLWKGVPTRDTLRRYASCIALAQAKQVKPADFVEWLSKFPGGIKATAAEWSKTQQLPEARVTRAREKNSRTTALLARFIPVPLPAEIGAGHQPGRYLAAIQVSTQGKAELVTVFSDLSPVQVDSFISRVLR